MSAMILSGREPSERIKEDLRNSLSSTNKLKLTIFQVGNNDASNIYIKNKQKACESVGIDSEVVRVSSLHDLIVELAKFNRDGLQDFCMIQLPIGENLNEQKYLDLIDSKCDVDCLTTKNLGKLFTGNNVISPCTSQGIIDLLDYYHIPVEGKNVVVVGRSNIVGKPIAHLMTQRNATVTLCHSKTTNLSDYTSKADILIVSIGKANFINSDMVKVGAVVIDVGINRDSNGKLCGDVDFEDVKNKVGAITPVPGGVGLMTVAELLANTFKLSVINSKRKGENENG